MGVKNFFKQKKWFLIIGGLILLAGGIYWQHNKTKEEQGEVRYTTVAVERGTLTSFVSASGNIIIDQQAAVDPVIGGTVTDLAVKVGEAVTAGQFLFQIINDDLEISVSRAAASYESAKNSLKSAEIDKDNAKANYEKAEEEDDEDGDTYTRAELKVLEDKIDLAEQKIIQAQKNLATAWIDYQKTQKDVAEKKVTAPISGTVNAVNIKNGDDLSRTSGSGSNTDAPIIIGDLNTLKAVVAINEVDIAKVAVGQKVILKFDALDSLSATGKVEKIDALGTIEQGIVSYNVTIGFDTLDERIKPQMSFSASLITEVKQNVLIVPLSGIKNENEESYYVEVLGENKIPIKKEVAVGLNNGTEVEILSGLNLGEEIITQTINSTLKKTTSGTGESSGNLRIPGLTGGGGMRN